MFLEFLGLKIRLIATQPDEDRATARLYHAEQKLLCGFRDAGGKQSHQ